MIKEKAKVMANTAIKSGHGRQASQRTETPLQNLEGNNITGVRSTQRGLSILLKNATRDSQMHVSHPIMEIQVKATTIMYHLSPQWVQ